MEQECETTGRRCGQHECECSTQSQCCTADYDKMAMMLYLAKAAKMELLKEKIKNRLEATDGKRLDRLADLLVEVIAEHRKSQNDFEKKRESMRERFEAIFYEE